MDTAVIGHLDSPIYLGGVAIGATATSFLFMLLLFSRMSTTGLTAQAYGAKDPLRLARALVQPLILAFGAGALIVLLRTPLIDLALHIVGGSDAVLEQARRFLEIRWLSAPASLANLVLLGWLGGGRPGGAAPTGGGPPGFEIAARPLAGDGAAHERPGRGAGHGDWRVRYAADRFGDGLARAGDARYHLDLLKSAWRGNIRSCWRLIATSCSVRFCRNSALRINRFGARLGPEIVAVNAVLSDIIDLTAYALDGFAYAVEAHSGQAMARVKAASYAKSGVLPVVPALVALVLLPYACFGGILSRYQSCRPRYVSRADRQHPLAGSLTGGACGAIG